MQALLVNLAIVAVVALAAMRGYRRGLVVETGIMVSLIAAVALAAIGYGFTGGIVAHLLSLPTSIANIFAYVVLVLAVQILGLVLVRVLVKRLHPTGSISRSLRVGGASLAVIQVGILIALIFGLNASLPTAAGAMPKLSDGPVAGLFSKVGKQLAQFKALIPASDLGRALDLLTVNPESTENIPLGFMTTSGVIDKNAEVRMLQLVNNERTARGLKALEPNTGAQTVARAHSRDMLARGYFSHINPDGQDPFARMRADGVQFVAAGENLALAPTLDIAHTGLMNSPGHRTNILSPDYGTVGIGIIDAGPYGLMITQDFTN